jgi:hypothetical protein
MPDWSANVQRGWSVAEGLWGEGVLETGSPPTLREQESH